jgi:hypothetical protein
VEDMLENYEAPVALAFEQDKHLPLMPISKTATAAIAMMVLFVTEYIAECKDWLGSPEPCPYRMEPQWAGSVENTAEATAA